MRMIAITYFRTIFSKKINPIIEEEGDSETPTTELEFSKKSTRQAPSKRCCCMASLRRGSAR